MSRGRVATGVRWSTEVRDLRTGEVLLADEPDRLLPTASVAKLFLLVEVAARLDDGTLDPGTRVGRGRVEPVGDSGLWQHLDVADLTVVDAARLAAAVSDNLATNVLLDLVGLDAVQARAARHRGGRSTLLDRVRDVRTPAHPDGLSIGCAADWVAYLAGLREGVVAAPDACRRVLDWLALGVDHSMVAAALDLDPLAHGADGGPLRLRGKTGRDVGVRADVGLADGPAGSVVWAAIARWDPADDVPGDASGPGAEVRHALRRIGDVVRGVVTTGSAPGRG